MWHRWRDGHDWVGMHCSQLQCTHIVRWHNCAQLFQIYRAQCILHIVTHVWYMSLCTYVFCTTVMILATLVCLIYWSHCLMVNCTVTHSESSGCRGWDQSVWLTAGSSQAQAPSLCCMASSVNAPAIMLLLIPVRCHTCLCLNSNASVWT